jgi:hypothetical protein
MWQSGDKVYLATALWKRFMDYHSLLNEFVKALVTGGSFAVVLAVVAYIQTRRRDTRDAIFKAFDSYLKVMDYRAQAVVNPSREAWHHYYRAMFDLQWAEFYAWSTHAIPDEPYRIWLRQRQRQYQKEYNKAGVADGEISYKIVWDELSGTNAGNQSDPYFDSKDPFIKHMNFVHSGKIDSAMKMNKKRR